MLRYYYGKLSAFVLQRNHAKKDSMLHHPYTQKYMCGQKYLLVAFMLVSTHSKKVLASLPPQTKT